MGNTVTRVSHQYPVSGLSRISCKNIFAAHYTGCLIPARSVLTLKRCYVDGALVQLLSRAGMDRRVVLGRNS